MPADVNEADCGATPGLVAAAALSSGDGTVTRAARRGGGVPSLGSGGRKRSGDVRDSEGADADPEGIGGQARVPRPRP